MAASTLFIRSLRLGALVALSACAGGDDPAGKADPIAEDTGADTGGADGGEGSDGVDDPDADADGVPASLDCDDNDKDVFPGAVELCNGKDDDCDGDEDEADAADTIEFFLDLDGDGWGGGSSLQGCSPPTEAVYVGGDCDDSDMTVRPDAPEICNDGIDNDCAPGNDSCEINVSDAEVARYGQGASANAARSLASAGDMTGDGLADVLVGADGTTISGTGEGAAYILPSSLVSSGGLHEGAWRIVGEEDGGGVGKAVLGLGDIDGDGKSDALIGADEVDVGRFVNAGRVWLARGGALPTGGGDVPVSELPISLDGGANFSWFGVAMASAGDVDNDGVNDVLIGSSGDRAAASAAGAVYLISGATLAGLEGSAAGATAARSKWTGETENDFLGARLAGPGDLDGDGIDDLVLASDNCNAERTQQGRVYFFFGPTPSGTASVGTAEAQLNGVATGDRAGGALSPAGDADGDGYPDVWVSVTRDDSGFEDGGAVYLIAGGADLREASGSVAERAQVRIASPGTGAIFGQALSGGQDWDADGENDLLVGVPLSGVNGEGAAYLFTGPFTRDLDANADHRAILHGDGVGDHLGSVVAFLPDALAGGRTALGLGTFEDESGGNDAGALYLFQDLLE